MSIKLTIDVDDLECANELFVALSYREIELKKNFPGTAELFNRMATQVQKQIKENKNITRV